MKQMIKKVILLAYLAGFLLTGCDSEDSIASCNLLAVASGSEYCQEISAGQ